MDQQQLRQWEGRCIQEEAPECVAACPIHVDARALAGHIGAGDWSAALAVLRKTMPLPELLGRICDSPCQNRCKRGAVGDAIRIGALEAACVSRPAAPQRIVPLPGRNRRVAVAGGGLSGLTVAWDLARKGYGVTLFDPHARAGEILVRRYPQILSPALVERQIALLGTLGVNALAGQALSPARIASWLAEFDAVFIGLDGLAAAPDSDLGRMLAALTVAEGWQTTERTALFAGGGDGSPVRQAAQGRWAATSIDRTLQKVSLTAGRDGEGPQPTRLHTEIAGLAPLPEIGMADPAAGYNEAEARAEAGRCLQCECLACVKVCPYLEKFGAYPRKYVREIYNNESIVMGARTANALVNGCSLCALCETVCPERFAMQTLCLDARRSMVKRGKMPPTAHEFALQEMQFSRGDRFRLARHAPGMTQSAHLFFPGCQLCASAPRMVEAVYAHLRTCLPGGVGLMLDCCAAPARWAGREQTFAEARADWIDRWDLLGRPCVIMACPTCQRMFDGEEPPVPLTSLWQVLSETGLPEAIGTPGGRHAVHDPCASRPDPAIRSAVRRLLAAVGVQARELSLGGETTECCGYGGLMQFANAELAQTVVSRRAGLDPLEYVTYCAMCRDNFAAAGKRCLHVLDLLLPGPAGPDPAGRPRPGWSQRRENRAGLKAHLLKTLWNEKAPEMETHRRLALRIAPEVAERLEKRRILSEDLQRVIAHAERNGPKLYHPESGRFRASFKPLNVTFWVEYAPSAEGFVVYNAYAHRMDVG